MRLSILALCCLVLLSGCAKDDRAKRASSLATVKAETALNEMNTAATDADKARIAQDFLQTEIPLLHGVEDYLFQRKPVDPLKP